MSENMLFCLGEGQYGSKGIGYQKNNMVFNKQLTEAEFSKVQSSLPVIELPISVWVDKKEMTQDEKDKNSAWSEIGGFLRVLNYEQAWSKWWNEAKQPTKDKILNCGYFDAEVFKGITGIDIKDTSLSGKEVEVKLDGKTYKAIIQ